MRTEEGGDARHLATVPVQTDTGQSALCLYSAQGDGSAAATIEPANTGGAEVITRHALYQGELVQGLETIPGIDSFRQAALSDLIGPTALLASASLAAAGRFLPDGAKGTVSANTPAANSKSTVKLLPAADPVPNSAVTRPAATLLLPSADSQKAFRDLTGLSLIIESEETKSFKRAQEMLEGTGFNFSGAGAEGAKQANDAFANGSKETRYDDWIRQMESYVEAGKADTATYETRKRALEQARRDMLIYKDSREKALRMMARLKSNPTSDAVAESYRIISQVKPSMAIVRAQPPVVAIVKAEQPVRAIVRAQQPVGASVRKGGVEAATEIGQAATAEKSALRGIALEIPEGIKNICSNGPSPNRLVKAGLCIGGIAAGLFGVGWVGAGAMGAFSSTDTNSVRTALAADAARSPDVVIDRNSYAKLIEGLRLFSERIAADPTIQSTRPTCQ